MKTIPTQNRSLLPANLLLLLAASALSIIASPASAVVLIRDGFGDGDLNNDGTAFVIDADTGDVLPDYEALGGGGSPALYPAETMVISPTVADNPSDTGILWAASGGFTSSGTGDHRSFGRIVDDSAGVLPETVGNVGFFNSIAGATQNIPALDSGLALGINSKGRGNSITGFFEKDQSYAEANGGNGKQGTIELGPNVDDTIKVSFDFRVWMSSQNFNTGDTNNHSPNRGEIRFGIFQDADDQLGQTNNVAGRIVEGAPTSSVWGLEPGWFRGDRIGPDANGDPGWYVKLPLKDPDSPTDNLFGPFDDGRTARIAEEINPDGDRHLQGSDQDTIASPQESSPGVFDFQNMETQKRYRIELSLRRFDETGGSTDPNDPGDNIEATVSVTNIDNSSETWSLTGFDQLVSEEGFSSEAWDYFSVQLAGSSASDDFDFLMDNFMVECFGSNCSLASDADVDGDVDGADFLELQRTDPSLISQWQADYPNSPLSAVSAVPEPTTIASLCLAGLLLGGATRRNRMR